MITLSETELFVLLVTCGVATIVGQMLGNWLVKRFRYRTISLSCEDCGSVAEVSGRDKAMIDFVAKAFTEIHAGHKP